MKHRRIHNPNPDAAWYERHARQSDHREPTPHPAQERLLRVNTGYFVAGAVWRKISNVWSCKLAAPILRWMVGMTREQAHLELLKRECRWEWIGPKLDPVGVTARPLAQPDHQNNPTHDPVVQTALRLSLAAGSGAEARSFAGLMAR